MSAVGRSLGIIEPGRALRSAERRAQKAYPFYRGEQVVAGLPCTVVRINMGGTERVASPLLYQLLLGNVRLFVIAKTSSISIDLASIWKIRAIPSAGQIAIASVDTEAVSYILLQTSASTVVKGFCELIELNYRNRCLALRPQATAEVHERGTRFVERDGQPIWF